MDQDDPAEALTELRERRPGLLELLQAAAGSGLAAYTVWALLLQPGFRRVPLRLQVRRAALVGAGPKLIRDREPGYCSTASSSFQSNEGDLIVTGPQPGVLACATQPTKFLIQVPYVGASARQVEHVLSLLRGRPGKTVDLGSGDGRIVRPESVYLLSLPWWPLPTSSSHILGSHRCWRPTSVVSVQLWVMS